jgi:ubiquinol-cytochrome c reductase cytochrome b subunit
VVGEHLVRFLRGGDHVTGGTLSRFYGWHVALLPGFTTVFLGLHLIMVQRHGMSTPPSVERRRGKAREMPFVPDFLLRDLFGWAVALAVLASLAAYFPWELGEKADPFAPAFADIKPEWFFMFMFQILKWVPGGSALGIENEALAILAFGAVGLVAFLVPLLDRRISSRGRSPLFTAAGAVALIAIAVLTAIGYHAWWPVIATAVLVAVPWMIGRMTAKRNWE